MEHTTPAFTEERRHRRRVRLAFIQGLYDLAGGLWPLLSMSSFEGITGNKRDEWLVRSVAGILVVLGSLLVHDAFFRRHIARTLRIMAAGISLVLGVVAVLSAMSGRVSLVYLPDGVIHLSFLVTWALLARRPWKQGSDGRLTEVPRTQDPATAQVKGGS